MATNKVKLQSLVPKDKAYREPDGGGLFVEVLTDGAKFWRLRYKLADKEMIVTLGNYPAYSLAKARRWRSDCLALIEQGVSPRALKRDQVKLDDIKPEAKELAVAFLNNWCPVAAKKNKVKNTEVKKIEQPEEIEKTAEIQQPEEVEKTAEIQQPEEVEKTTDIQQSEETQEDEDGDTLEAFAQRLDEEIAELAKSKDKQKKAVKSAKKAGIAATNASNNRAQPRQNNVLKRLLGYVWKK
ncbi:MAG: Arm DNA-binding domain-containing protein [Methylococcaceae bacterium]